MAKFKIKHTITKKEWNKKHKDFKSMIDGVPYIMMYDDKTGTHLVPVKIVDESVNEGQINEWKLQLDLGNVNPSEFENWANDSLQKKHKIKVSGSGKNWTIVGKGNDDRMGSSADWISQLLGKAWKANKIKVVQRESVNEATDFETYHKSYTHAIEAAKAYALKKGYEISDDELFSKVAMNSKRPGVGKTTKVSLELLRNGKPQKKMLHIQVYGMDRYGYELNAYIN